MIEEKDIYTCIRENKAPFIRLYDMNKHLMHTYDESADVETCINHLTALLPMFKGYGKIVVNCATQAMKSNRWTNSYYMTLHFANAVNGPGQIGHPNYNPWQMPAGFIHQDVMLAKLEKIEASNKHSMEMMRLELKMKEKSDTDPAKQLEKFFPYALYAMGKDPSEIAKVAGAMRMGNANLGANAPATAAPTNSLTFKSIQEQPTEEKVKKFQSLADSIGKKVCIEEMIMLYDEIDKDPTLVRTALDALPLLKKK